MASSSKKKAPVIAVHSPEEQKALEREFEAAKQNTPIIPQKEAWKAEFDRLYGNIGSDMNAVLKAILCEMVRARVGQ